MMPKATLHRRYHFSASHRLHSEAYSAEQNQAVFGKCNNPFGHGHNYVVEVAVSGPVDQATGMVCDLALLDGFARTHVVEVFDHSNLNTHPAFQTIVPTTENLCVEIERIFQQFTRARVETIHIEETGNNSFDYAGRTLQPALNSI